MEDQTNYQQLLQSKQKKQSKQTPIQNSQSQLQSQQSHKQQQSQNQANIIHSAYSTTQQNMNNYPPASGHSIAHLPFHPQAHPAYLPGQNPHMIDYSISSQQSANSQHYPPQIHNGYHQHGEGYLPPPYQTAFDYDHQLSQYGASTGVSLGSDNTSHGNGIQGNLPGYGQYSSGLSTQHYSLDPNSAHAGHGQYHNPLGPHPNGFPSGANQALDQNNYLQFGSTGPYPGAQGHNYLSFNPGMASLNNEALYPLQPYGLLQNSNQIGLIDQQLAGRTQQLRKDGIKSEEQAMENELNLGNSLGDSSSQADGIGLDKQKQSSNNNNVNNSNSNNTGQFGLQQYDQSQQQQQQQHYQAYYPFPSQRFSPFQYPPQQLQPNSQLQQGGQQQAQQFASLNNPNSSNNINNNNGIKDNNKDDKKQPNSPGRKKTIKKPSPTTEPSSPASPRGRKRKNTGKPGELPESPTLQAQSSQPQAQQPGGSFNLHLMKVPSQPDPYDSRKQFGFISHAYNQVGQLQNMDQTPIQILKDLQTDFNMNDFANVNDDQKQIGTISKEERQQKIRNYQEKRKKRSWTKKISYDVRKKVADSRLRDKGRFVTKKQAMEMLSLQGKEEDFTMDQLKDMLKQRGLQNLGGEEDSKSPTLQSKKSSNNIGGGKQMEEYEEGYEQEVHSEEQLPAAAGVPALVRGKSCEGVLEGNQENGSLSQQYFENIIANNNSNKINNMNNNKSNIQQNDNQLKLKLEQKDSDNNNKVFKQIQATSNNFYPSSSNKSQSPSKSPKKQNTNGIPQIFKGISQSSQQQEGNKNSTAMSDDSRDSPSNQNNILSQEVADQFGSLNIKSPEHKPHKMNQPNTNQQIISLNHQAGSGIFFNNQGQGNYIHTSSNYVSGNNTGYPIHQQQ